MPAAHAKRHAGDQTHRVRSAQGQRVSVPCTLPARETADTVPRNLAIHEGFLVRRLLQSRRDIPRRAPSMAKPVSDYIGERLHILGRATQRVTLER